MWRNWLKTGDISCIQLTFTLCFATQERGDSRKVHSSLTRGFFFKLVGFQTDHSAISGCLHLHINVWSSCLTCRRLNTRMRAFLSRSSFTLTLPSLITPGKVWPPAVNTDPTVDVQFAQPQDHLRAQLYSAVPTGASLCCTAFIFSLLSIESRPCCLFPTELKVQCVLVLTALRESISTFNWKIPAFLPTWIHLVLRATK